MAPSPRVEVCRELHFRTWHHAERSDRADAAGPGARGVTREETERLAALKELLGVLCIIGVLLLNQIMAVASNITGGGIGLGAQSIGRFFTPAQRAFGSLYRRGNQIYQDSQNAKGRLTGWMTTGQQQQITRKTNTETAAKLFKQKLATR